MPLLHGTPEGVPYVPGRRGTPGALRSVLHSFQLFHQGGALQAEQAGGGALVVVGAGEGAVDELLLDLRHQYRQIEALLGRVEAILDAYETVLTEAPRADHRFRIEHCQMATEAQLDRMQRLGVMASFFAVHTYYWGDRHERLFLGPGRAHRIDPLASALGREIHFALHSDCPVTPVSPLMSVWSAVTRITREGRVLGPEQRVAAADALRAFTLDAAYLAFEDGIKGSLAPGKLADLVVLERDPLDVPPEEIRDIHVSQTLVGGEVVWADGGMTFPSRGRIA